MNLKEEGNGNDKYFEEILTNVKLMLPIYKDIKNKEDFFDIKEGVDEQGNKCLHYKYIKEYDFTDFNGKNLNRKDIVDEGKFYPNKKAPELILVEREKTDETRCNWAFWRGKEYRIKYWEIKKYIINGGIYDLKIKNDETWEDDDEEGEKLRREKEKELNNNIKLKV